MPDDALPENLRGKNHTDYPKGLQWIPRGWTAFKWGEPKLIDGELNNFKVLGKARVAPKPIDSPGGWQLSFYPDGPWYALYFAFTTKGGMHFRVGARWDDVDDYVEFPSVAIKRGIVKEA